MGLKDLSERFCSSQEVQDSSTQGPTPEALHQAKLALYTESYASLLRKYFGALQPLGLLDEIRLSCDRIDSEHLISIKLPRTFQRPDPNSPTGYIYLDDLYASDQSQNNLPDDEFSFLEPKNLFGPFDPIVGEISLGMTHFYSYQVSETRQENAGYDFDGNLRKRYVHKRWRMIPKEQRIILGLDFIKKVDTPAETIAYVSTQGEGYNKRENLTYNIEDPILTQRQFRDLVSQTVRSTTFARTAPDKSQGGNPYFGNQGKGLYEAIHWKFLLPKNEGS